MAICPGCLVRNNRLHISRRLTESRPKSVIAVHMAPAEVDAERIAAE